MKNRLIELMQKWGNENTDSFPFESVADFLISEGVIVPPCKVGQTVYVIQLREIYECRVNEICISAGNNNVVVLDRFINGFLIRRYGAEYFNAFGKTVFLTREEAEQALKGAQGK